MGTNSAYYQQQLNDGQAFQDFIAKQLYREGIVLMNFQSRAGQHIGENMLGLEIKFDKRFAETGSLWIETAEKTDPALAQWVPSGIDRDDNSWLYGIGNYEEFLIFSKRTLREHARHPSAPIRGNQRQTSRGFLLTRSAAMVLAERHFRWTTKEPVAPVVPPEPTKAARVAPAVITPRPVQARDSVPLMTADEINWGFK